jgi:hypothetical protein
VDGNICRRRAEHACGDPVKAQPRRRLWLTMSSRDLIWFCTLIVFAGCDRSGASGPRPSPRGVQKVRSNAGTYEVTIETYPDPVPLNQPFAVFLTITPGGTPKDGLEVQVDARMPFHFHGMNRVAQVTRLTGNSWKAEGLRFHMPGAWELYVDISQGGVTERAQMDVELK